MNCLLSVFNPYNIREVKLRLRTIFFSSTGSCRSRNNRLSNSLTPANSQLWHAEGCKIIVTPLCNDQSKAEPTVPTHVPFCDRQMLLTSAPPRSDLSKQPCYTYAEMHNPIFSSFPGYLVGWWSHICKSFTWDELHEVSVLYNPPRLKGFPNFLSLYSLDLPPGSEAFKSHQRFRLYQFCCRQLKSRMHRRVSFSLPTVRSCISKWRRAPLPAFQFLKVETDFFTWWFLYFWMNHIIHKLAEYLSIRLYRDHSSCLY